MHVQLHLMRTAAAEGLQVLKAAAAGAGERMPLAFSCSSATCWAELLHVQARLTHRIHSLTCSSAAPSRPSHLLNASRSCSQRSVASETCARSSEQKRQRASLRARVVVERHLIERVGQLRRRRHLCLKLGLHARTSVTLQHCACTPSHARPHLQLLHPPAQRVCHAVAVHHAAGGGGFLGQHVVQLLLHMRQSRVTNAHTTACRLFNCSISFTCRRWARASQRELSLRRRCTS